MAAELLQSISTLAASLAAIFSGVCAFLSYGLSRKIQDELKSDERIIAGIPIHPDLRESAHSESVIQCTLFNKSKRKAYLDSISAYDHKGKTIGVTWSDEINHLGNPQNPCQLIGIVDSCPLYIRRNDGEAISYARLEITHSFSEIPMIVIFDPFADWGAD